MNKRLLVYETLLNALRNDKTTSESEDDKTFRRNTTEQIVNRDTQYTELLSHFVKITKIRNSLKEFFKWTFYLMIVGAIVALIAIVYQLFHKYIVTASIEQIVESVPLLITAMVGFVSTIITIPVTITKYLFSTEEDKNITEIILHTQEHDTSGRQWATDFKKILEKTVEAENSHSGEQSA
ncbi:MAG: hypothetical protein MR020_04080 [Lachnospiraceae bacterium]|nr:hypothetical protein [Lachnospiraceae bacterium]